MVLHMTGRADMRVSRFIVLLAAYCLPPLCAVQILAAAVPAVINYMPRLSVQMLADILVSYAEVGLKDEALLAAAAQVCWDDRMGLGLHSPSWTGSASAVACPEQPPQVPNAPKCCATRWNGAAALCT